MRKLGLLLKLRLNESLGISAAMHEKNPGKKILWGLKNLVLLAILLALAIGIFEGSSYLCREGYSQILPVLGYLLSSVLTLILTIVKINDMISADDDAEFLLALPVGSMTQVLAMFLLLYLENLILVALIQIPSMIAYAGASEVGTDFWGYWIVGLLMTSLPASGVAALIGFVLKAVLSTTAKSNQIQSLVALGGLSLIVIFLGKALFAMGEIGAGSLADHETSGQQIVSLITSNYKPAQFYQLGVVGESVPWCIMFVLFSALWYVFFVFLMGVSFQEMTTAMKCPVEYGEYVWKTQEAKPLKKSIFARELNQYFRSRTYFTTSFFLLILGTLIAAVLLMEGWDKALEILRLDGLENRLQRALPGWICLFAALGNTTYCSLSMEGKRHWIVESLPFEEGMLDRAKVRVNLMISLPAMLITAVLYLILCRPGMLVGALCILLPLAWAVLVAEYGIRIDRRFADYTEGSESHAMHGGISFFLGYLPPIALAAVLTVILFVF